MIPATVRIFVCTEPQDMRRSFDRLARTVEELMGEDPQSGALFVFTNKRTNRLKCLWWDKNGYALLYKRLHGASFVLPADGKRVSLRIDAKKLAQIVAGVPKKRRGVIQ